MRAFCVVFPDEIIERHLLLRVIFAGRPGGFLLQGQVHALMLAILLRMAWLDAFDGDTESEPPHPLGKLLPARRSHP